ncbi:MAG: excinuclease ABC subunit UvrC [Propionibacteriaceae bacterium]|jgi:excinuclease ABC subunit C|nr:excinuclease ABC subunit UvrC [Propionibacteriaceae bacterium]
MADPASYRPKSGEIPTSPGVYKFIDADERVIYVGKAKNLRNRLNSYFRDVSSLHFRTQTMVRTAARVEWTVVQTELEALQLEWTWINEYDPRFNVIFRDDKSYPWAAISWNEEFPRVWVGRGPQRKGVRYFGPYQAAWAIRQTIDTLLAAYPMRSCTAGVFRSAKASGRPCLMGDIGKCSAPCVGRISAEEHRELAADVSSFLSGGVSKLEAAAKRQMEKHAEAMEYEQAATWRDRLQAIHLASAKNAIVFLDGTDADVIALAEDPLEVSVSVFSVRGGRVVGERGLIADRAEDSTTGELLESFLLSHYSGTLAGEAGAVKRAKNPFMDDSIPPLVLVPEMPASGEVLAELLSEQRGHKVEIRVPQRGDKRTLLDTVAKNAADNLRLHKARRASDLTTRSQALEEIRDALGLEEAPLRIECYDISHTMGENVVGSMVVFEDGLAKNSDYRRFTIKGFEGSNDVMAIHEVISRRFSHQMEEEASSSSRASEAQSQDLARDDAQTQVRSCDSAQDDGVGVPQNDGVGVPQNDVSSSSSCASEAQSQDLLPICTPKKARFAYSPSLIVVDGGAPQVAAAQAAMRELGVDVPLCGLAKRLEEVWLPGEEYPLIMPRNSEGLYLLQRVRDESHRFAITYHRQRRGKSMLESALDGIPGLGKTKQKALRKRFTSYKALKAATVEELQEVDGIGPKLAGVIHEHLASAKEQQAVNLTTGEIL